MKIYPFKKTVLDCKKATRLALKKESGAITLLERVRLSYHLLYCVYCRRFVKQSALINKTGKELQDSIYNTPLHSLSDNIKAAIQEQLDKAGE